MRLPASILILFVVTAIGIRYGLCADAPITPAPEQKAVTPESKNSDEEIDILSIRDPFAEQLPVVPEVKQPETVYQPIQIPSNPMPVTPNPTPVSIYMPQPIMQPMVQPIKNSFPRLQIQGIVWNADKPQAIINDQVLGIGEQILGAKIKSIQKHGIYFSYNGRKFHVRYGQ